MPSRLALSIGDNVFQCGELAVFCGAGVSRNSGLPLANELKRSIFETLLLSENEVDEVLRVPLPFEAFIQSIFDPQLVSDEALRVTNILDLFHQAEPNSNHIFIARLAKAGYLKTVATTNFDLLFERAFKKEGLRDGVDFKRYYTEDDFSTIDFSELGERLALFKLHGSIDDRDSVRTTLEAVYKKELSAKRFNVIKHLFSTGKHTAVLILGYSCSDIFDVVPQIQRIQSDLKQIFYLKHSASDITTFREISATKIRNPFIRFPGKWIECNTDSFVRDTWKLLEESIGEYEAISSDSKWGPHVESWLGEAEVDLRKKFFIAARVLGNIGLLDLALSYCKRAQDLAVTADDLEALMPSNHEMGTIYQKMHEKRNDPASLKRAAQCYEEALEMAESLNAEFSVAESALSLGIACTGLSNFNRAIDCISYACNIYTDQKIQARIADSRGALGYTYDQRALGDKNYHSRDMDNALKNYRKALNLYGRQHDKLGAAVAYCDIGNVYGQKKNFPDAIQSYKRAEKKLEELGDIIYLRSVYENLAQAYAQIEDIENIDSYRNKLRTINQIDGLDLLYI